MNRMPELTAKAAIVLLAVIGPATPLAAQTRPAADQLTLAPGVAHQLPEVPTAPNGVDEDLADAASRPAGLLKYGPVSLIDPLVKKFNRATEDIGLNVGLSYTVVFQAASGGPGIRDAAGGDLDLFGNWRLLGAKDDPNRGLLYFAAEQRHKLGTEIPPASLDQQIGSLWGTTNAFNERPLTMKELYWQQQVGNDHLIVRVGKLDPENYYNSNYWQSDSRFFLNQAFSSFPVRAFPGNGLGTNIVIKPGDLWYVSTGVQDAQGAATQGGFDTFFGDFDLFYAGEFGLTPTIGKLGKGTYRFTGWYRDAGESNGTPHDAGFDLSFDQHVGPHWIPFFRYGWGEGHINDITQMISTGIGWEGDLITPSDVIGLAGAWGKPAEGGPDQYAIEAFYRLQVAPANQVTVGYQVIIDPTFQPDEHVVGVFEIRWRTAF